MEQQRHTTKNDGTTAICELNALNRTATMSSSIASTSAHTSSDGAIRTLSMIQHRQPMLTGITSIARSTLFSDAINNHAGAKVQMSLNPRYISKITNTSTRKIVDTSLRMRPYFIPERSRTKSENSVERDSHVGIYTCAANNFLAAAINSNCNASMMETCDGYGTMDATANTSASNSSHASTSGFSGINAFNSLHNNNNNALVPLGSGASATILPASGRIATKQSALLQWKKSKSLEDVRAENIDGSQPSHEMEFVSSRIQKLKVQE